METYEKSSRGKIIDLTGLRFGKLVVLNFAGQDNYSHVKWKCVCDCGNIVEVVSGNLREGTLSCGCFSKEVAKKRMTNLQTDRKKLGLHGNRWNPELSMENRALHGNRDYLPETHEWRKNVYSRDRWTCQACGYKGKKIIAHHKESWGSNKELRFDIDNGGTCCVPCHKEFHTEYGYGNNTTTQWDEFIESKNRRIAI